MSASPPQSPSEFRKRRREGGGGFSSKPSNFQSVGSVPVQPQQKVSTQEILEQYRKYNPNQSMTNHNKSERQLYVGNIPDGISNSELCDLLNEALINLGKEPGIFQEERPVVGAWISGDGHYAFVDFRTADEATQGFVLQQVQIKGLYLKVGRPKNATGIIPTPSQLLCGDPNFNPNNSLITAKSQSSAVLVQQALKQSKLLQNKKFQNVKYNQRLHISNLPIEHNEEMVYSLCSCFGKVVNVEMVISARTKLFTGTAYVDFETENDAKQALNRMMGMDIEKKKLFIKKAEPPTEEELAEELGDTKMEGEIFKQVIDEKISSCLVLKNCVQAREDFTHEDYKEMEFDFLDEMERYGKVLRCHLPRPPKYGDPHLLRGFGKVYVRFSNEKEAEKAKTALFRRRLNEKMVEVQFYPLDKFENNNFE